MLDRCLVGFALLASVACGPQSKLRGLAPDIVLVSIDSLRHDHLGCYGYPRPTSPTIDDLARGGARFVNAVSTTSWTLPAHAALFTGLYDATHGLVDNGLRLAEGHKTLAEVLREAGYHTAGFFGGPYLHPTFGFAQGFDVYRSCMSALSEQATGDQARAESRARDGRSHDDVTGPRTLEAIEQWADEVPGQPYFLFIHLWDVHYDYLAPSEYVEIFDPGYQGELGGVDFMGNPAVNPSMPEREYAHLLALYDAEIRFTDEILGRILKKLAALGRPAPLVIVTADHGEEFFEHGGKGHQRTLFEEVLRVPLVVHWPGTISPGIVAEEQVGLIDLLPTLAEIAGASEKLDLQGMSLVPRLLGRSLPERSMLCELNADGRQFKGLRTNQLKLLEYAPDRLAAYDLSSDPQEQRRLASDLPEFTKIRAELQAMHSEALRRRVGAIEPLQFDSDIERRLRELGYIENGQDQDENAPEVDGQGR